MNTIVFSEVFDARTCNTYRVYGMSLEECKTPWTFTISVGNAIIIPYNGIANTCGWVTEQEAENAKAYYKKYENYVALVLRYTGYRGDMVVDKLFKNIEKAHEYIMSKVGTFGRDITYGCNILNELYGSVRYNDGYELKLVKFDDQE